MESFFHTLKAELAHHRRCTTRTKAQRDLFAHVKGCCNRQRIHAALGDITPEQAKQPKHNAS